MAYQTVSKDMVEGLGLQYEPVGVSLGRGRARNGRFNDGVSLGIVKLNRKGRTMKDEIKKKVLEAISGIPEGYLSDEVIKETIRCILYGILRERGLTPIPAFRNPRYPEGPVDVAGMKDDQSLEVAFCSNPLIELDDVKRLDRVPGEKKFVISFSRNQSKLKMTTLYLKPGIEHIGIYYEETGQ